MEYMVLPKPVLKLLFIMEIEYLEPYKSGEILTRSLKGGFFKGKCISGKILEGGIEHCIKATDGLIIDGKYTMKTDDGEVFSLKIKGRENDGEKKLHIFFEIAKKKYKWLNEKIIMSKTIRTYNNKNILEVYSLEYGLDEQSECLQLMNFEYLYHMNVKCPKIMLSRKTNRGVSFGIPIKDGRVEGKYMNGEVEAIRMDRDCTRQMPSYVNKRYIIKTDGGAIISLFTEGIAKISAFKSIQYFIFRKKTNPFKYFCQHVFFETDDERYKWLNQEIAFAIISVDSKINVCYDVYILN